MTIRPRAAPPATADHRRRKRPTVDRPTVRAEEPDTATSRAAGEVVPPMRKGGQTAVRLRATLIRHGSRFLPFVSRRWYIQASMTTIAPDSASRWLLNRRRCSGEKWFPSGTAPVADSGWRFRSRVLPPTPQPPNRCGLRSDQRRARAGPLIRFMEKPGVGPSSRDAIVAEASPFAGKRSSASDCQDMRWRPDGGITDSAQFVLFGSLGGSCRRLVDAYSYIYNFGTSRSKFSIEVMNELGRF